VLLAPLAALAALLPIAGSGVDHRPLACAVPDRFVRLEARAEPARTVGSARIYFRAAGADDWHWVSMRAEGALLRGVLPKPLSTLTAFAYYIEMIDLQMTTARTAEATVRVAPTCDEMAALLLVAPPVVVSATGVGAPVVPVGFSLSGVVAAGAAGTSNTVSAVPVPSRFGSTTALVAGGIVAAGLAVAAVVAGGEPAATLPSPSAGSCPPPAGSGSVQSQTFAWTLPAGASFVAQRFELPFQVTGAGVVEARTSYLSSARVCVCVGTRNTCRPDCVAAGASTLSVQVCEIADLAPGQWSFQVYCQTQEAGVCITPLPAGGLSGTTTVTYSPR